MDTGKTHRDILYMALDDVQVHVLPLVIVSGAYARFLA